MTLKQDWREARPYRQRQVLITGGLGFLGLNLAKALLAGKARVKILDVGNPPPEGPWQSILNQLQVYSGNIDDEKVVGKALSGCEVIFNLAGKSGAALSNAFPLEDLEVNVRGHLTFLEICRRLNPAAKIIFPSSRLVYKPTEDLPVPEAAPLGPQSIYGIHKLAGENYHLLYSYLYDMRTTILRITNPYGPFQRPEQNSYGIINWFINLALKGKSLPVYGDGSQLRDYIHVDDVARAFLLCGMNGASDGKIFNAGGGQPVSLGNMAKLTVDLANSGQVQFLEWPASAARIETGNFFADISAIKEILGWTPRFTFEEGLLDVIEQCRSFVTENTT